MSVDDITASADAARNAVDSAKSAAEAARNEAYELAQDAGSRGWEGVAATVQSAHDSLEAVITSLNAAGEHVDGAKGAAGEITNKMSHNEVADRLGPVLSQLDQARDATNSADSSTTDAHGYSQQAEVDRLTDQVNAVTDAINSARLSVEDTKSKAETEQQEAASWGN